MSNIYILWVTSPTLQSKEKTDNAPTDKTKQGSFGMKQRLRFQILSFLKHSNNK